MAKKEKMIEMADTKIKEMRIVDIQPRDIYITLELSLSAIDELLLALSKSKIVCDGKGSVEKASKTLTNFFDMLQNVSEHVSGEKSE